MLEQVHDHIVSELGHSSRTDSIFVVTAVVFNLIVLGINSGVAFASTEEGVSTSNDLILAVFIGMTLVLNIILLAALFFGRRTRSLLLHGLITMYHDNDVDKYYDPSLLSSYGTRYLLFAGVIATLALTAIAVHLSLSSFGLYSTLPIGALQFKRKFHRAVGYSVAVVQVVAVILIQLIYPEMAGSHDGLAAGDSDIR